MVFFHLIFLFCTTIRPKIRVLIDLFFHVHATIRPKYTVLFYLFFLLNTTIQPKIRVHTDLFLLFLHHHSAEIHGPHLFIFFMCTRPFDKNIWSSFINSFSCARPFGQKLRSTLIYFFICTRSFDQKLGPSLIYCFYLYTTIRLSQGSLLLFYLFFSQMCQYFVCYIHGRYCPCISSVMFLAVLPISFVAYTIFIGELFLYFVRYIHGYMKSYPYHDLANLAVHYIPQHTIPTMQFQQERFLL